MENCVEPHHQWIPFPKMNKKHAFSTSFLCVFHAKIYRKLHVFDEKIALLYNVRVGKIYILSHWGNGINCTNYPYKFNHYNIMVL